MSIRNSEQIQDGEILLQQIPLAKRQLLNACAVSVLHDKLVERKTYIIQHRQDIAETCDWTWYS